MNDEIKEILDNVKKCCDIMKDDTFVVYQKQDILKILNYITNLQQENEVLKKNQRYYKNGVFSLEYDKETLSDMVDDYKSRVEKAVEYIKNEGYLEEGYMIPVVEEKPLLNILQNRSDEE